MLPLLVKRYRNMMLLGILTFYLGCTLTLSFLHIECVCEKNTTCVKHNENDDIEYPVVIISGPDKEYNREAIRATWANFVFNIYEENGKRHYKWNQTFVDTPFIKIFFVIGTKGLDQEKIDKINSEQNRTNDLLLFTEFEDTYENLAQKMLNTVLWVNTNLRGMKYLVKCDDDSFLRIDLILTELEAFAPEMADPKIKKYVTFKKSLPSYKGLYWGYFDGRARVYLSGKWEERDWFLCDTYLPYALGGGYVISKWIVDFIAENYYYLSRYHSEDVSMGVWTAPLDGINRVHDIRFDTEWKSRGCNNTMLVRHKQTTIDMFHMYDSLSSSNGEILCKKENVIRKSYHYKWNGLPSMCCNKG